MEFPSKNMLIKISQHAASHPHESQKISGNLLFKPKQKNEEPAKIAAN